VLAILNRPGDGFSVGLHDRCGESFFFFFFAWWSFFTGFGGSLLQVWILKKHDGCAHYQVWSIGLLFISFTWPSLCFVV